MFKRLKRLGAEDDRHQGFHEGVGGVEEHGCALSAREGFPGPFRHDGEKQSIRFTIEKPWHANHSPS